MSTETKEEVTDARLFVIRERDWPQPRHQLQEDFLWLLSTLDDTRCQLAQLTREVEVYRAACQAVVKADLLCNDGSISNQIEAAIEQARAALAIGKEK